MCYFEGGWAGFPPPPNPQAKPFSDGAACSWQVPPPVVPSWEAGLLWRGQGLEHGLQAGAAAEPLPLSCSSSVGPLAGKCHSITKSGRPARLRVTGHTHRHADKLRSNFQETGGEAETSGSSGSAQGKLLCRGFGNTRVSLESGPNHVLHHIQGAGRLCEVTLTLCPACFLASA